MPARPPGQTGRDGAHSSFKRNALKRTSVVPKLDTLKFGLSDRLVSSPPLRPSSVVDQATVGHCCGAQCCLHLRHSAALPGGFNRLTPHVPEPSSVDSSAVDVSVIMDGHGGRPPSRPAWACARTTSMWRGEGRVPGRYKAVWSSLIFCVPLPLLRRGSWRIADLSQSYFYRVNQPHPDTSPRDWQQHRVGRVRVAGHRVLNGRPRGRNDRSAFLTE